MKDIEEKLERHEKAIQENLQYRKELEYVLSMLIDRVSELQRALMCLRDQFAIWIDGKRPKC